MNSWVIYAPLFMGVEVKYISWGYVDLTSLAAVTGKCPVRFLAQKRTLKLIGQLCGTYPSGTTLMVEVPPEGQSRPEIWVHPAIAAEFAARCSLPGLQEWFKKKVFHRALENSCSVFRSAPHSKWPTPGNSAFQLPC